MQRFRDLNSEFPRETTRQSYKIHAPALNSNASKIHVLTPTLLGILFGPAELLLMEARYLEGNHKFM